jgi:hypothetical protein
MNMTKNKILAGFIGIGLVLLAVLGVYLTRHPGDGANPRQTTTSPKVENIEEVVRHPDRYKGFIGVLGKLIKIHRLSLKRAGTWKITAAWTPRP